jgi:hypothetical protein
VVTDRGAACGRILAKQPRHLGEKDREVDTDEPTVHVRKKLLERPKHRRRSFGLIGQQRDFLTDLFMDALVPLRAHTADGRPGIDRRERLAEIVNQ